VIRTEWSAIFPLGITNFVFVADRNPSVFENGLSIANKRLIKPGNYFACLVFGMTVFDIVVRESHVKRILARNEVDRDKIPPRTRVRAIVAPVVVIPVPVPGAAGIGNWVVAPGALADPEDGGNNADPPGIPSRSLTQSGVPARK
jgi:hypothetical protein